MHYYNKMIRLGLGLVLLGGFAGVCFAQFSGKELRNKQQAILETNRIEEDRTEDYFQFLRKFAMDSLFQKSRVVFPMPFIVRKGEVKLDTIRVQSVNWKYKPIPVLHEDYRVQVYDNFKRELLDSGQRVLSVEGNGNGLDYSMYFSLIQGKWYLVRIEDKST
jgi:hypothetical protein